MSLKSKINPHNMRSNEWIMNSPEALVILKLMGSGIGFLFFAIFSTALGLSRNWFLMGLFGLLSLISLKQFISMIKSIKSLGFKDVLGGITAAGFIWRRDKNWKKLDGGVEDGSNGQSSDEMGSEQDAGENKRIRKEIGHIYRQPERPCEDDSNELSNVGINSKEVRD